MTASWRKRLACAVFYFLRQDGPNIFRHTRCEIRLRRQDTDFSYQQMPSHCVYLSVAAYEKRTGHKK